MARRRHHALARAVVLAAAAWALVAASSAADRNLSGPSLSRSQQEALAPLQRDWASIETSRKEKWLEVASKFPTMPPDERLRVQQRMAEWARLTPTERGQARLRFQESRQLTPQERQARWEAYQALPDEERRALAQRAKPAGKTASAVSSSASGAKQNLVSVPVHATAKPVAPTVVQAKPGATTTLMSTPVTPPAHSRPGEPKITASQGYVNPNTLLPQAGPQRATVRADAASAPEAEARQ
jgi:hypothetical protein